MSNDFKYLCQFLDTFESEVEGHHVSEPSPDLEAQLEAFARGELEVSDRDSVVALALSDERVLERLAAAVREIDS